MLAGNQVVEELKRIMPPRLALELLPAGAFIIAVSFPFGQLQCSTFTDSPWPLAGSRGRQYYVELRLTRNEELHFPYQRSHATLVVGNRATDELLVFHSSNAIQPFELTYASSTKNQLWLSVVGVATWSALLISLWFCFLLYFFLHDHELKRNRATSDEGLLGQVHEHVVLEEFPSPYCRTITVSAPHKGTVQPSVVAAVVNSRYIGLDIHCHLQIADVDNPASTLSTLPSNPVAHPPSLKPISMADHLGGVFPRQLHKASGQPCEKVVSETTKATAPTLLCQPKDAAISMQLNGATMMKRNGNSVRDTDVPAMLPFKKQRIQGAGGVSLQHGPCGDPPQRQANNSSVPVLSPSKMQVLPLLSGASFSLGLPSGAKQTSSMGLALGVASHSVTLETNIVDRPMDMPSNALAMGPVTDNPARQTSRAADFFKILQRRREVLGSASRNRELIPPPAQVHLPVSHLGDYGWLRNYPLVLLLACAMLIHKNLSLGDDAETQ